LDAVPCHRRDLAGGQVDCPEAVVHGVGDQYVIADGGGDVFGEQRQTVRFIE
jgi:hypothetical protein